MIARFLQNIVVNDIEKNMEKPKAADAILRRNTPLRTKKPRSSSTLHGLRNTSYSRILQNMSLSDN